MPRRFPNADPETQFWPTGYLTSKEDYQPNGDWKQPSIQPKPNPATIVDVRETVVDCRRVHVCDCCGGVADQYRWLLCCVALHVNVIFCSGRQTRRVRECGWMTDFAAG